MSSNLFCHVKLGRVSSAVTVFSGADPPDASGPLAVPRSDMKQASLFQEKMPHLSQVGPFPALDNKG